MEGHPDHLEPECEASFLKSMLEAQLAKAAPIIEAQIMKWGDSLCPHVHRVLPNRPRRACDICWETLKEGKEA